MFSRLFVNGVKSLPASSRKIVGDQKVLTNGMQGFPSFGSNLLFPNRNIPTITTTRNINHQIGWDSFLKNLASPDCSPDVLQQQNIFGENALMAATSNRNIKIIQEKVFYQSFAPLPVFLLPLFGCGSVKIIKMIN